MDVRISKMIDLLTEILQETGLTKAYTGGRDIRYIVDDLGVASASLSDPDVETLVIEKLLPEAEGVVQMYNNFSVIRSKLMRDRVRVERLVTAIDSAVEKETEFMMHYVAIRNEPDILTSLSIDDQERLLTNYIRILYLNNHLVAPGLQGQLRNLMANIMNSIGHITSMDELSGIFIEGRVRYKELKQEAVQYIRLLSNVMRNFPEVLTDFSGG